MGWQVAFSQGKGDLLDCSRITDIDCVYMDLIIKIKLNLILCPQNLFEELTQ